MKYASIDIETTGLDWERCQVLAIGVVVEDTLVDKTLNQLPKFRCLIRHGQLHWEPVARQMNEKLMEEFENPIPGKTWIFNPEEAVQMLRGFLETSGFAVDQGKVRVLPAGKNFSGFDRLFLDRLPGWCEQISLKRRALDPAMLYTDLLHDQEPPTLEECKRRAGLADTFVTHDPLLDALDVVRVLRGKYR